LVKKSLGKGNELDGARRRSGKDEFWALRDVSFDIEEGDIVGIVGKNGAGKSTLLKILSRITEPTKGRIDLRGRVASLLEVGTGFHPELTGRENVFLNGAILGMSRVEIKRKFDEIVEFAGVEKFLDTPVKRYSSGMYVRLAFAVAAHLEPEILIIDEVLAVGDAAFQAKCIGRMSEVASEGRTVLFVSHNMSAVSQLCRKGILLENGSLKSVGTAEDIVCEYLSTGAEGGPKADISNVERTEGGDQLRFTWAELTGSSGEPRRDFNIGDEINLHFGLKSIGGLEGRPIKMSAEIRASDGLKIANMLDADSSFGINCPDGEISLRMKMDDIRLYPGTYYISLWTGPRDDAFTTFDKVDDCLSFEILNGGKMGVRTLPRHTGLIFLTPDWSQGPAR
jgi:lipopolysaccharide transport system ATP-binding protein